MTKEVPSANWRRSHEFDRMKATNLMKESVKVTNKASTGDNATYFTAKAAKLTERSIKVTKNANLRE